MPHLASLQRFTYRLLAIAALPGFALLLLPSFQAFLPSSLVAKAATETDVSLTAKQTKSSFQWNIKDASLPLISFPDHLGGSVDLALTYSMDRFQFPLFQSLYYNAEAGKYILMVMSEREGAKFIDLPRSTGEATVEALNNSLRLTVESNASLIRTENGTTYAFAKLADGELHCRQIKEPGGLVIDFGYTNDASLATITDDSGRTVRFDYTQDYLSSITQTWGPEAKKKKTWAIDNDAITTARSVNFAHARAGTTKRIPTNAVTPAYTREMAASDLALAAIFGGDGAMAAGNGFEPVELGSQYPLYRGDLVGDDGVVRRGHLSFAMHLYGSADGTAEAAVYVPAGFTSHSADPTPTDAAISFYYPRLGNLSDVTLVVFHIANFQITPEGERVRIGNLGGRGGSVASYKHAHIEFYRGNTGLPSGADRAKLRIDPAIVFGPNPATASR